VVNGHNVYGTAQIRRPTKVPAAQNPHAIKINAVVQDLAATAQRNLLVLHRNWNTALNRNGQNVDQHNSNYRKLPDIIVVEPLGRI